MSFFSKFSNTTPVPEPLGVSHDEQIRLDCVRIASGVTGVDVLQLANDLYVFVKAPKTPTEE